MLHDLDLDKFVLYDSTDVQVEFAYLPDLKESHNLSERQSRHRMRIAECGRISRQATEPVRLSLISNAAREAVGRWTAIYEAM